MMAPANLLHWGPLILFVWAFVHLLSGTAFVIAARSNRILLLVAKGYLASGSFSGTHRVRTHRVNS